MSLALVFARGERTFQTFVPDATLEENFSTTSFVTEYEIEDGAAISDHVRPQRRRYTARAVVSNTPIRGRGRGDTFPRQLELADGNQITANVLTFEEEFDAVREAWELLLELQRNAIELTIRSELEVLEGYVLSEVTAPRTSETGSAATFLLTFQEIRKVSTRLVDAPTLREERGRRRPEEPRAEEEENVGAQTEEATEAETAAASEGFQAWGDGNREGTLQRWANENIFTPLRRAFGGG